MPFPTTSKWAVIIWLRLCLLQLAGLDWYPPLETDMKLGGPPTSQARARLLNVERPNQSGRTDAPLRQKNRRRCVPIPPLTGKPRPRAPAIRPSLSRHRIMHATRRVRRRVARSRRARGSSARTTPADRRFILSALHPHHSLDPLHPTQPPAITSLVARTHSFRNPRRNATMEKRTRRGSEWARAGSSPSPLAALGAVW
jgi:hypothetical protein